MPSVAKQSVSHVLSARGRSLMANEPTDKALYARVKAAAKKKFKVIHQPTPTLGLYVNTSVAANTRR